MTSPTLVVAALCLFACERKPCEPREPCKPRDSRPAELAPTQSRDELLRWVTENNDAGKPRYQTWARFLDSNIDEPLGLPVHGRYTTMYANPIAHAAGREWSQGDALNSKVEFPAGSIIVKANTFADPNDPVHAPPGALTIMYKPGIEGYCQTQDHWSKNGCYGGGWMFVFYEVPDGPLRERSRTDFTQDVHTRDFCVTCHAGGANDDYIRSLQRVRRANQPPTRLGTPKGRPPTRLSDDPLCLAPTLEPTLPQDVAKDPASLEPSEAQRMFDCLSWRSFIALNWPAAPRQRGEPDVGARFWDITQDGYAADSGELKIEDYHPRTRVWEQYKEVYELFQTGPGRFDWDPAKLDPPLKWSDAPPAPRDASCAEVGDDKLLMMVHKNRTPQPPAGQGVINEEGQAFAGQFGKLVDQNGRLVRYDVRINRSEYEFVLDNDYAATAKVTPGGPVGVLGTSLTLPDNRSEQYGEWGGSIELKGAWRELCLDEDTAKCPARDDPSRYFTEQVWVYEGGKCRQALMGLVGMHIAHKTWWAPQWVWSTFEHVDLVPEDPEQPGDALTALFNPECPAKLKEEDFDCTNKPFLAAHPCCPNVPFDKLEHGQSTPNQVTRLQAIGKSARALNAVFAELSAGSPFENYVLIDTQWPLNGRVPGNEAQIHTRPCNAGLRDGLDEQCYEIVPQFLRNTSMESFMATYELDDPHAQISNRGCLNCHGEAGADFSYLWLDAVNQRVPSVVP